MKLTKKKLMFGAVALAVLILALFSNKLRGADMGVTIDAAYVSDYIRRGVSVADESVQARLNVTIPVELEVLDVTNVYGKALLNNPLEDGVGTTRDLYVGAVFGTELVQLDVGARYLSVFGGDNSNETYAGAKLDVFGNPGVYACRGSSDDFNSYELRVQEAVKWGVLPAQVATTVSGRVGRRDAPVETTFYQAGLNVGYPLSDNTQVYAGIAYGGTSTDLYDEVVAYTVGVKSEF